SSQSGAVRLYGSAGLPGSWEPVRTLVEGVRAIDPTLFHCAGRWWLLFTDGTAGEHSHLCAFFSSDLISPFVAHANNTIEVDVRSSRPAGRPFLLDGRWFRRAQNDSVTYGGSIVVNEILRLDPVRFEERVIAELRPSADGAYPLGLHTLNGLGEVTVVDG